jgi:Kef-type K+ transport system membrane component KefB
MVTFSIAILLASGLIGGKICQKLRLPSVTGYIVAGLLLGPSVSHFITEESIGHSLDHFTKIALMLIAFGIGEHIELKKLKDHTRTLLWIGVLETSGAFAMVSAAIYITISLLGFQVEGWSGRDYIALSLLLGAVGVATAPAATLLVIRELKARGPLTSTLMAIVAIDDGLAIMIFGLIVTITKQIVGQTDSPFLTSILFGFLEIGGSLTLGLVTGAILIFVLGKLKESGELITAGLAILLLCSEVAIFFHLSPLLAGMAAGFILVNKVERDVRLFRAFNTFEPPIYVLFFTLAGTHLNIVSLKAAGIIGIIYFLSRIAGKIIGVSVGARIAGSPTAVRRYLGFALLPQAGVAIGLIFLLSSDPSLVMYTSIITPVVLAGVFLSELIGPISAKFALTSAKETGISEPVVSPSDTAKNFHLTPWTWQPLEPPKNPKGYIVFHGLDPFTARALGRMATIFAYHYGALPMSVRIVAPSAPLPVSLFLQELEEVHTMGYPLATELVPDPDLAEGLVTAVEYNEAKAVVLAYPLEGRMEDFRNRLETITAHVHCPVAVIRFHGVVHTERILVPLTSLEDLADIHPILLALNSVGEHRLQLLYMMSSTAEQNDIKIKEEQIISWLKVNNSQLTPSIQALPTQSRLDTIKESTEDADLIVMGAPQISGVERLLFGSLVDSVAKGIEKTMIIIYNAEKGREIPDTAALTGN